MKSEYKQLSAFLKKNGFSSYAEYLQSKLWQSIRRTVLNKYSKCFSCKRIATQVHHKSYTEKNLSGKSISGLVSICEHCHNHIEITKKGKKVDLSTANGRLKELRTSGILPCKKIPLEEQIHSPPRDNWSFIK